jgi:GSCFA family
MSRSPYSSLGDRSFWSRAVARKFSASDVVTCAQPLLRRDDIVMSAGSCFASNLVPYLEDAGYAYVRTEGQHPAFSKLPNETLGYDKFSARYGNIYTVLQMLQLVRRCLGRFRPRESHWRAENLYIDPYRPGLRYPARSLAEFEALTAQHLAATRVAIEKSSVFIFTLGLTEGWVSKDDGAVFPACPGTVTVGDRPRLYAGSFDVEKHTFKNFSVAEVSADLRALIAELREINPDLRVILTVSPVPLVATAGEKHVLAATAYSKAVLRVAAEESSNSVPAVIYFPAYELVTGPQAPSDYFEHDLRNVSKSAVDAVMAAFLAKCEPKADAPAARSPEPAAPAGLADISKVIVEAECEEAMADGSVDFSRH